MNSATVKLSDLVRLAFEGPVDWLVGDSQVDALVSWVTSNLDNVSPGDVFVAQATGLEPESLAHAKQRGAVGVILLGKLPPIQRSALIQTAISIPIISAPGVKEPRTACRDLLTTLVNQNAAMAERGLRIYTQLSQLAAQGRGLSGLVKIMAEVSGHGVLVQDKRGRILAEQCSSDLYEIWDDVLDQLASLDSLPVAFRDRNLTGRRSRCITQELPGGLVQRICPIVVSQVARGYLSLIANAGELDSLDQVVIDQGCLVCAVEMSRDKAVRETEKRLKGELLTALLEQDLESRDARLWVQTMGLDLSQAHIALRFAWDGANPPSRRRLETLVNGEVTRLGAKVIVNPMGAEVICFCQVPAEGGRPELAIQLGQAVLDQSHNEYPNIPARCGIGIPALDLTSWRDSFRQAGQALEMARRLAESRSLYFPDLSVYRLLMQIEHNPELISFQEETIGPLLAYEGGNDLIYTLEEYFQHKGNLTQTAEALFIHRNTLLYRIERIKEILKLNLDDPTARLAVQLALHIYRMMGSKPGE